jgi:hypothetical protein
VSVPRSISRDGKGRQAVYELLGTTKRNSIQSLAPSRPRPPPRKPRSRPRRRPLPPRRRRRPRRPR